MTAENLPDPLAVAAEHIAYLRRSGASLTDAAAAIGAPVGAEGWDGLTWAYARVWHELRQGVAVSAEEWNAENSNGRTAGNSTAGWFRSGSETGHCGGARFEPSSHGFKDCRFAPEFQARRFAVGVNFRRKPAAGRLRLQSGGAK